MIELSPSTKLANEIIELASQKYKLDINDTIRACLKVAASVAAHETKIDEEEKVKAKLLQLVGEAFDEALVSVRM